MKFSLATLLLLVLLAALGCAALVNANDTWRQSMVTLVLSVLLIATLAAAVNRSRAFALGFAVAGWIYLLLVFVPALGLRDDLLTDKGVRWLYTAIHDEVAHQSNQWSVAFTPDGRTLATAGTVEVWNAQTGSLIRATRRYNSVTSATAQTDQFTDFTIIGHSLWVLIVACVGGAVASVLAPKRTNKSTDTTSVIC